MPVSKVACKLATMRGISSTLVYITVIKKGRYKRKRMEINKD
jgi:hypothetical protein